MSVASPSASGPSGQVGAPSCGDSVEPVGGPALSPAEPLFPLGADPLPQPGGASLIDSTSCHYRGPGLGAGTPLRHGEGECRAAPGKEDVTGAKGQGARGQGLVTAPSCLCSVRPSVQVRLQTQSTYRGIIDCMVKTYRHESVGGAALGLWGEASERQYQLPALAGLRPGREKTRVWGHRWGGWQFSASRAQPSFRLQEAWRAGQRGAQAPRHPRPSPCRSWASSRA